MASYTRFADISVQGVAKTGGVYAVGAKGSEVVVINSSGAVLSQSAQIVSFLTSSAAQTLYTIAPYNGNVVATYVASDTANISAAYTVKVGSAGNTIASVTQSTAASVAGFVTTMTLGTVAVTAGQSISVLRGVQGTASTSQVVINIVRTS